MHPFLAYSVLIGGLAIMILGPTLLFVLWQKIVGREIDH